MSIEINLTANEWDIMKIIWELQPCTLRQICDEANKHHDWTRHAVISFLKRMYLFLFLAVMGLCCYVVAAL